MDYLSGPYVSAFPPGTLTSKTAARSEEIDYMFYKPEGTNFKMELRGEGTFTHPPQATLKQDGFMIPHGQSRAFFPFYPKFPYQGGENGFPSDHAYLEASFRLTSI